MGLAIPPNGGVKPTDCRMRDTDVPVDTHGLNAD
jgi:hypothetical protein